jgi:tetratricopeptide (TPR) repeat protein
MTNPQFEYLFSYIALLLDTGDETRGLEIWLQAVDEALEKSNFPQAQQLLEAIRRFHLSPIALAQVELGRAYWHESRVENEEAVKFYQNAIKIFRRIDDQNDEALASNSLGLLYQKMSLNDQAVVHFRVAAKLYKRLQDHKSRGEVLSNIGIVADAQKDWLRAIPYYERAIREFTHAGAKRELAGAFNNLGVANEMLGDFDRAEEAYRHCFDLLDEIKQSNTQAGWRILSNLAQLHAKRRNQDESIRYHKLALQIASELGSDISCAISLNNLGTLHEEIGERQQAADYYRQALNYQREGGDSIIQAVLLNNLGSILTDLGSFADAKIYFDESIALSREAKDLAGEARTLNNMAVLLEEQGQLEDALHVYQQAEAILSSIGDTRREIMTLINIASVSGKNGNDAIGRAAFLEGWRLACRESFQNELAILFQWRGDWSAAYRHSRTLAKRWYEKAIEACTDETIRAGLQQRLDWLAQHGQ